MLQELTRIDPTTSLWVCGNYREEILHKNKDFVLTCDTNIETLCTEEAISVPW